MVYLTTSTEWQRQSSLLLQARPSTTRITTKYNIPNLSSPKYQKRLQRNPKDEGATHTAKATLTLKTYDPSSGVTLKFKTDRAAEVGRLIMGLGRVGRGMANLPEREEGQDVQMEDAEPASAPAAVEAKPQQQQQQQQGGGGGKKKKKGKK